MLEETYFKFKKNILPKMKKTQPNFQEPVVEYCELAQVIDICSYNHYPILDKSDPNQENGNHDNDIYNTSELEHEFEYGMYEDVLKTEQLMAELKRIDEAETENQKLRDVQFENFPLEQFSDAGKVANEGDPHLKLAADTELYNIEKRAIQIDINPHGYDNSSENADDNSSLRADDAYSSQRADNEMTSQIAEEYSSPVLLMMMIMQNYKPKLVTCNYPWSTKNTMFIMMIIHCVEWSMDQRMCHTMKTARNYCCCKLQICHAKTI